MEGDLLGVESGSLGMRKSRGASMCINNLYMMYTLASLTTREKLLIEATQLHLVSEAVRYISMVNKLIERESSF